MQLRIVQQLDRQPRHAGGDARRLQRVHRRFGIARGSPGRNRGLDLAFDRAPSGRGRQASDRTPSRRGRAAWRASATSHREETATTIQLSAPAQGKQPCGTKSGWRLPYFTGALPSIECAMIQGAANGIMHSICARSMNWPLPVRLRVDQRGEHRGAAVQAADGIAERGVAHDRRPIGIAHHARQARALLQRRAIGAAIAVHAAGAERRHRHHHELWIELAQDLVAETELRQHLDRIIVDHEIGVGQQPLGEIRAPAAASGRA